MHVDLDVYRKEGFLIHIKSSETLFQAGIEWGSDALTSGMELV
jgi:hypothetical protein